MLNLHYISAKKIKLVGKIFTALLCVWIFSNQASNETKPQPLQETNQSRRLSLSNYDSDVAVGKYLFYYIDTEKNKTILDLKNLEQSDWLQSQKEIPSFGYQKNAIWFRLQLQNDLNNDVNYIINIANSNLDDIQIYTYLDEQMQQKIQMGDSYPFAQRKIPDRNFLTPIKLKANSQYEIYIRVFNLGTLQIPLYIQSEQGLAVAHQSTLLLWGIYFGLTLIMGLYNFILFISVRDNSYLLFSFFIFTNILFHACLHGFGFQYVWPNSEVLNEWIMPTSNALLYVSGGMFISQFVELKKISVWQYRIMMLIVYIAGSMTILSSFIPYQKSVLINTMMGFPFAIMSVLACVTALRQGNKAVRFFLVSWLLFVVAAFILTANKMGVIPRNMFTENGLQIGNAFSILFIALALADSINIEKKQRMLSDKETLRLEKKARRVKEEQYEADLQAKEAELKAQQEIIIAREEGLLAQAQSKTKSRFLATMSHEIRTPLNGILGISEMLRDTSLSIKQQELLSVITSSGRTLLNLINDVLDLSKIEAGRMEMECRVFDVRQLHRETIKNFELLANEKSIELICEINQDVPTYIKSDSNRLQQVLLNLLGNALKFTEKGNIRLKVSCCENSETINQKLSTLIKTEVIDSGIGLTEKQQSKLFQSFSQADSSTTRKYGGTGLGLSISKKIIEHLDGNIGVISKENQGANFWFSIPSQIMKDEEVEDFILSQSNALGEKVHLEVKDKLKGLTVLVAEDNKVNQMVIKAMLSKLGLKCYFAENGEEALEHVKNYHDQISVVLMDCEMPVMDGYQATREIRLWEKRKNKKALPILAVTAHALDEMVQDSFDAGMNGHISKPIDKQVLHDALIKHLVTQ